MASPHSVFTRYYRKQAARISKAFRRKLKKPTKLKNYKVYPTHTTWTVVPSNFPETK